MIKYIESDTCPFYINIYDSYYNDFSYMQRMVDGFFSKFLKDLDDETCSEILESIKKIIRDKK